MEVHRLADQNSIINQFIAEIRDASIQKDAMRYRRNIERIGEVLAYEISKELNYSKKTITTPLGEAECKVLSEQPILITILRAGLPLHQGLLNYFDHAPSGFVSAYRRHQDDESFDIHVEYLAAPSLDQVTLILSDPMLATGQSIVTSYKALLKNGTPKHVHVVAVIASEQGVEYAKKNMPENTTLWLGAVDKELTPKAYIYPGLGDAGDLAFGDKL